jgi:hypothetical protein
MMPMKTSGSTAVSTTSDTAVVAIAAPSNVNDIDTSLIILNEGGVVGFFSIDNGITWARLPAGGISLDFINLNQGVQVKRVAGGTNLSGIWVMTWKRG